MIDPMGNEENYVTYDANGNLKTFIDRYENIITNEFDNLDRLVSTEVDCIDSNKMQNIHIRMTQWDKENP